MSCPWPVESAVGVGDFCEALQPCAWVLQPISTASALSFLPVALLAIRWAWAERQPALHLLTAAAGAMAVGTVAQHVSGTWTGMVLDHAGMELTNVVLLLLGVRRLAGTPWRTLLPAGLLLWAAIIGFTELAPAIRRSIVVVAMVPSAGLEAWLWFRDGDRISYRWWLVGWVVFLAGSLLWTLDRSERFCSPDGFVQLHAAWHVASAVALLAWTRYYVQFDALRPAGR